MPTVEKVFSHIIFEWDSDKAFINFTEHNVSFEEALTVLLHDDFAQTYEDTRDYHGEQRYITLGMSSQARLLYIVWTLRDVRYRMISARKANKYEQKGYNNGR